MPKTVRILSGLHPYTDQFYCLTLYDDGSIRIERPFSCLIRRCGLATLEEDHWEPHKHLIGLLETRTITDKHY